MKQANKKQHNKKCTVQKKEKMPIRYLVSNFSKKIKSM